MVAIFESACSSIVAAHAEPLTQDCKPGEPRVDKCEGVSIVWLCLLTLPLPAIKTIKGWIVSLKFRFEVKLAAPTSTNTRTPKLTQWWSQQPVRLQLPRQQLLHPSHISLQSSSPGTCKEKHVFINLLGFLVFLKDAYWQTWAPFLTTQSPLLLQNEGEQVWHFLPALALLLGSLSTYPGLHRQVNDPKVFSHSACSSQSFAFWSRHSLKSSKEENGDSFHKLVCLRWEFFQQNVDH